MANGLTYTRTVSSVEEMKQLAGTLAPLLHRGDVIVLSGDLGAGKTQFVQGIAAGLGITAEVTSPTFNILLTYDADPALNHFDLYRLESEEELDDIGYWDVLEGDGASFVEWGDKFPSCLPSEFLRVVIDIDEEGNRCVTAHSYGARYRSLLLLWSNDETSRLQKCGG